MRARSPRRISTSVGSRKPTVSASISTTVRPGQVLPGQRLVTGLLVTLTGPRGIALRGGDRAQPAQDPSPDLGRNGGSRLAAGQRLLVQLTGGVEVAGQSGDLAEASLRGGG